MDLIFNQTYRVKPSSRYHQNREGRFQFLGGPDSDVVVLESVIPTVGPNVLFCVGLDNIVGFDPKVDSIIQEKHLDTIRKIDEAEEVFQVLRKEEIGDYVVMWVNFPNCPNSNKIMVYEGNPPEEGSPIDPHFGREHSPIARFVGNEYGWTMANVFASVANTL